MTNDEIEALASEFFRAIEHGDVEAIRGMYAPTAHVWHNYDEAEQDVEQNLQVLSSLISLVKNRRYERVQRVVIDGGFVQQHVLRGDAPGGRVDMPVMMRVWTAEGRVTRIDEYLDPARATIMRSPRP